LARSILGSDAERLLPVAKRVKQVVKDMDPDARVLLVRDVTGSYGVAVVTRLARSFGEKIRLRVEVMRVLAQDLERLDVYILPPEEYGDWVRVVVLDYIEA